MQVLAKVFPSSVIILCVFHVLKWMHGIFRSALVSMSVKDELMTLFKALVYAKDEDEFKTNLREWYDLIDGIEVKVVSTGNYVKLAEYFDRNWVPVIKMWALFERKKLPLGAEHTTNRLERTFRSMKLELKTYNIGEVSMARAVYQLVSWAENQIEDRYIVAQRSRMPSSA